MVDRDTITYKPKLSMDMENISLCPSVQIKLTQETLRYSHLVYTSELIAHFSSPS